MRKLFLAIVLSLSLAGCANVARTFDALTTTIDNPVTPAMLYEVENGLTVAAAGLVTYRRLCIQQVIDATCRDNIRKLQPYTRQIKPLLASLRKFVRENDQVNARVVFGTLRQILTDLNLLRSQMGIT